MEIDPGTLGMAFEVALPELTPGAALVLLRIVRKELARQEADQGPSPELDNSEALAS